MIPQILSRLQEQRQKLPRSMWRIVGSLIVVMMMVAVAGCGQSPSQTSPTPEPTRASPVTVGLLLCMTEETPFFVSLVKGAAEVANRQNIKLIVQYANDDAELQRAQIRSLVEQKVSALLVNPVSEDVVPDMDAASAAGVAVFTVDRGSSSATVISHIASDNMAGGEMAGKYLAEALHNKGNVVELQGTSGSAAARDRGAGFNQVIAVAPEIKVIARETANFNKADGKTIFAAILAQHPQIDGVFAHNDDMILGAVEAAKEAGRADKIAFVGFDAIDDAVAAVEQGDLIATIAQRPEDMGRLGVETVVKHLKGEKIPKFIPVDLALITR